MATLRSRFRSALNKTIYPASADGTLGWLDTIMAAAKGSASGEDALSVLNRKLEASGVLGSGAANPVFANETALFYRNTTNGKLFTRGSTSYDEITIGEEEANIIGHAAQNPPIADANSPWIYINTAAHTIWFKERSGSAGSYTYAWTEPVTPGDYQLRIIYHTSATPPAPVISWNARNQNFNVTSGGWNQSDVNAKWMRIVALPGNTNTAAVSPVIRVGNPTAADIVYTHGASINNVEEGLNEALSRSGSGDGASTAAQVSTTTTDFIQNLSSSETNVQLALNKLDKLDVPPYYEQEWSHISDELGTVGSHYNQAFTIPDRVTTFRDRWGQNLYLIADSQVQIAPTTTQPQTVTFFFEILDSSGRALTDPIISDETILDNTAGRQTKRIRVIGILPSTFNGGQLNTRVTAVSGGVPPVAGVDYQHVLVMPDPSAIDSSDFDGNLSKADNNLQHFAQTVDDLIIPDAYIQQEDLDNITVRTIHNNTAHGASQQITIDPDLIEISQRLGHSISITAMYDVNYLGGLTGDVGHLAIRSTDNFDAGDSYGRIDMDSGLSDNQRLTVTGSIPHSANMPNTFYVVFGTVARIQTDIPLDNGFAVIERDVGQSVNDEDVAVASSDFYSANNFIGGLNENTGVSGIPITPTNVQQALVKTDYLLQAVSNPYQTTELLDRFTGSAYVNSWTINDSTTTDYSSEITVPQELRDLGVPIDIRLRIELSALGSTWAGNVALTDAGTTTVISGVDAETVNSTIYPSPYSPAKIISFSRTIPAATARNLTTFRVRFQRESGSGQSATFQNGFVDIIDSAGAVMGGAGGQTGSYTTAIIWLAGAGIHDRLTQRSESINRTLMAGHRFQDYDRIAFIVDAGPGATQPLMSCEVDRNLFEAFGSTAGYLNIQGQYWLMFSRQSDTEFRWRWGANANGLRRVMGINTN